MNIGHCVHPLPLLLGSSLSNNKFEEIKFQRSYGKASGIEFSVQKGITVSGTYQIKAKAVTIQDMQKHVTEISKEYQETKNYSEERARYKNGGAFGFLFGFFGMLRGDTYQRSSENQHLDVSKNHDEKISQSANRIFNIESHEITVNGSFSAEGLYIYPTKGHVYVETLTVQRTNQTGEVTKLTIFGNGDGGLVASEDGRQVGQLKNIKQLINDF